MGKNQKTDLTKRPKHFSKLVLFDEFNKFFFMIIIDYLANVYEGRIKSDEIEIFRMYKTKPIQTPPISVNKNGLVSVAAVNVVFEYKFQGNTYYSNFYREIDSAGLTHYYISHSFFEDEKPHKEIGKELLGLSLRDASKYEKNKVLLVNDSNSESINSIQLSETEIPVSKLDEVFVRTDIKRDVERFIYAFKNYDKIKTPLRYLFSGKPGLGKTEIVRAVITECKKHGVVIIPDKVRRKSWSVFEFANLFSRALVCVDDIDLFFGTREDSFTNDSLGRFLSMLDGISKNKFFLIATTNDKTLVDIAASRPGRFDEIIDFGNLEKEFYLNIVEKNTDNEIIINYFDDEVLGFLEKNKVTGAYIANLIKQLKLMSEINKDFSKDDLIKYIERSHKGFYSNQIESKAIGF